MEIRIAGQDVLLLAQKAVFLVETRSLLIADMHIGKAMHFRKSGMAMPTGSDSRDLKLLSKLIVEYSAAEVVFLGDLFHSHENTSWKELAELLEAHPTVEFALVPGNHDRFSTRFIQNLSLQLMPDCYEKGPFLLTHAPLFEVPSGSYNFCGHIHPGVTLAGRGRMSLKVPCFWLGESLGVLPAFGELTGLAMVFPKADDRVIMVVDGKCLEI